MNTMLRSFWQDAASPLLSNIPANLTYDTPMRVTEGGEEEEKQLPDRCCVLLKHSYLHW